MTSRVRVGVRIRPITSKETSQGGNAVVQVDPFASTVSLSNRKFTYDSVFHSNVSQSDLYGDVAPPLLDAFLNGYNATVLAYGQTGSGKTYTMGSESHGDALDSARGELSENDGLIPRFMADMFSSLERRKEASSSIASKRRSVEGDSRQYLGEALIDFSLEATFLEVYGEDIHDLLDEDRKSLPIREDSNGEVIVVGLSSNSITSDAEAMNVLNTGTMNRTTAATLMNVTSSRSHAVFTVNLKQTTRGADGVDVVTSSRFTFVDLAGSERMKKTGAEGERMKEGIRINEGLLALGNVINALADEERLSKGEKVHVPYRQSKLTRLLQDALGGNSQTLFLACVSPSDTNASETLSTLQYANRARNIKNAPTRNVDAAVSELRNLRALTNVLKCELIKQRFEPASCSGNEKDLGIGQIDDDLLLRTDVLAYMTAIDEKVADITGCAGAVSSYPMSISSLAKSTSSSLQSTSTLESTLSTHYGMVDTAVVSDSNADCKDRDDEIATLIVDVDPDEDIKILDELLELQHRDQQFQRQQQDGQEELNTMEGEIEAQEGRLNKLRENLIMYHNIKAKYEQLMCVVHGLESEKQALADALEKAQVDPTKGCSKAIKRKLQEVEESLARARSETRKHQQMYRQAEQEAQKCKVLERKIADLKHAKVNLMKKQKEDSARHKEFTNQKTREIHALKRKEKTAEKKISMIEAENQKFRFNLERSRAQNQKLSEKLKQTETHLIRLLTKRRNDLTRSNENRQSKFHDAEFQQDFEGSDMFAASNEEVNSLRFLLEKTVSDRVTLSQQLEAYETKVVEHGKLMQSMAKEVNFLTKRKRERQATDPDSAENILSEIKDHEENVQEYQLKLELVENDLQKLRAKCPRIEEYYFDDDPKQKLMGEKVPALKMISKIEAPVLRTLLWDILESHVKSEHQRRTLKQEMARKESTLRSFEKEIEAQNEKIEALSKSLGRHRRLTSSFTEHAVDNKLERDIKNANAKLEACLAEKAKISIELDETYKALNLSKLEHAKAEERLALACAKQKLTQDNDETSQMLTEMQDIWAELGMSMNDRQAVRERLLHCVEDACSNMLAEASELRESRRREVNSLRMRLHRMRNLLGINETGPTSSDEINSRQSIEEQFVALNDELNRIRVEYDFALERCKMLVSDTNTLVSELRPNENELSQNLCVLMQNADVLLRETSDSREPSFGVLFGAPVLSASFLDVCEKDIKQLRLVKSGKLISNVELCDAVRSLSKEMHANAKEVSTLVLYSLKRRPDGIPPWWNDSTSDQVFDSLFKQGQILVNTSFTNHLNFVLDTLQGIAHGRRLLSAALKQVVEESHDALLATAVGCEMDVKDLYESLHDALFRLPPLSKQHVQGCIDEMHMLVTAAESITQSEVETLTVLWEGLNLSSSERGHFWSKLEELASKKQMQTASPFDRVLNECNVDIEEWVLKSLKEATKVQRMLGVRVFKLRSIHDEVERLKKKQDAKNGIMSLNGELKLLSAKLADFEEKAGDRNKLTNKRVNSSSLLEEERFRKQMQGMFASKLEALGKMLNDWEASEGTIDDSDMLSEVVKGMLENSHRIDAWMNERTRFMHLRTTQTKSRETEHSGSNVRPSSKRGPISTPRTASTAPLPSALSGGSRSIAKVGKQKTSSNHTASVEARYRKTPLSGTSHNSQHQAEISAKKSPTVEVPEVLLPFGDLLADTPVSKENKTQF